VADCAHDNSIRCDLVDRGRRAWRALFVVYFAGLTVGTHWPRLVIDVGGEPAPDKLVHMIAFGGLALLLWLTRWIECRWRFAAAVLIWPVIDEFSQAIPFIHRTPSPLDLLAGELGALTVIAWRWALGPVAGHANRARLQIERLATERAFGRARTWLTAAAIIGAVGVVTAPLTAAWISNSLDVRRSVAALGGILVTLAVGGPLALVAVRRRERTIVCQARACASCGESLQAAEPDPSARILCRDCGATGWLGAWCGGLRLTRAQVLRRSILPGMVFVAAGLAIGGVYLLSVMMHDVSFFRAVNRTYAAFPDDLQFAIDLALIALLAAVAVRWIRARLGRCFDRQHEACIACGHDVRASRVTRGEGQCTECGWAFHTW
jgi:hypothetical protein